MAIVQGGTNMRHNKLMADLFWDDMVAEAKLYFINKHLANGDLVITKEGIDFKERIEEPNECEDDVVVAHFDDHTTLRMTAQEVVKNIQREVGEESMKFPEMDNTRWR